ncbi:MAG: hypothetical protein JSS67_00940 [Bacteroidetes bacterium]|nr:hypothetical protein [Bacteroidota bacterium]
MKNTRSTIYFLIFVVAVTTIVKFICAPNLAMSGFSTIIAMALFAGLKIKDLKVTFLFPLIALFISDALIQGFYMAGWFPFAGFYSGQLINYILLLMIVLIGVTFRKAKTPGIVLSIIMGPLIYFFLSNFQVWASQTTMYSKDIYGLMDAYIMGLPFLKNSFLSTLVFVPCFIGVYKYFIGEKHSLLFKKA